MWSTHDTFLLFLSIFLQVISVKMVFIKTGVRIDSAHFGCPFTNKRKDSLMSVPVSAEGSMILNNHEVNKACIASLHLNNEQKLLNVVLSADFLSLCSKELLSVSSRLKSVLLGFTIPLLIVSLSFWAPFDKNSVIEETIK